MNSKLTKREREIAELVAQGKSNIGIAYELNISKGSVHTCLNVIYSKLFIENDEQTNKRVVLALRMGKYNENI